MFKNRFLIVLGLLSMLLVATAVARPFLNVQESSKPIAIPVNGDYFSDYFQRHTERASNLQDMVIPRTGSSESPDYFQRHSELSVPGAITVDANSDFYLRHPEWTRSNQNATVPVTGISESLDYFQRHPELSAPAGTTVDMTDYFVRHPDLRTSPESDDLSDYFLRH